MKDILKREDLDGISVSSYGTSSWHEGDSADPRAIAEGKRRGVEIDSIASPLTADIALSLDLILVMDKSNYKNVLKLLPENMHDKVKFLGSFEPGAKTDAEISDTYYGDSQGFAKGFEHISRCCEGLYVYLAKFNS